MQFLLYIRHVKLCCTRSELLEWQSIFASPGRCWVSLPRALLPIVCERWKGLLAPQRKPAVALLLNLVRRGKNEESITWCYCYVHSVFIEKGGITRERKNRWTEGAPPQLVIALDTFTWSTSIPIFPWYKALFVVAQAKIKNGIYCQWCKQKNRRSGWNYFWKWNSHEVNFMSACIYILEIGIDLLRFEKSDSTKKSKSKYRITYR